ncbi:nodulation protein NfeD [Gaiella sp.]|uniref:NfeD family protein n=1 Tax=Gaiella sp. TaxID=2663207 RepID=UPI002B5AC004|nr:nodulation protein NfeD [Gaiella sp.]HWO80024.1 nodulation protein NfeD [Gaiella sp.]
MDARLARALWCLYAAAFAALLLAFPASAAASPSPDSPRVLVVEFDNDVNPVTQDYLEDEMHRAERDGFSAVVIEMDTPGGLGSSMREIVKTMLALKVPVVVYVAPPGSSADSAGAVIGQAADVLAMAPQTNIGSSTPISATGGDLGKDLRKKVINDAAAYIAELAREHGRNADAAEAMVRDAANFGAREALAKGVIDVMAPTVPALLEKIDGTKVVPKGIVLHTAGAQVERVEMGFWKRALDVLIDPNIIALMLSLGLVGILVELWNPGLILPGTVGVISLLVGLYGLQVLPVSAAGVLLMLFAAGLFVAEAFIVSHGALALAGAVTFVIGALMLFDPAGDAYQVSVWTAIAIAGTLALLLGFALSRVVKARRNPVEVGVGQMVGGEAVVRRDGWVSVGGELWRARSADGGVLVPGEHVTVEAVEDDLGLVVGSPHPTERA